MDTTKEYIRHLSLCSGYEGIGTGLRRVFRDVREVAHVEIEAFVAANLVAKMEAEQMDPSPVFTNLKEFPFRKFRGCVDILSGGFPCQPFSSAGSRKSTQDSRHLFPHILRGIEECQPSVVFMENVEGIISAKTGDGESVLKYVLRSLEEVGYRATAGVFSASEVGAPHQRKRVFIMAYRKDFRCGRGEDQDGADRQWLQKFESEEQPMVRGEAEGCSGDTRGELGNTQHDGRDGSQIGRSLEKTSGYNTQGQKESCELERTGGSQGSGDIQGGELADTNSSGRREDREQPELRAVGVEQSPEGARLRADQREDGQEWQGTRWPARPNEDQYGWEEPRTITKSKLGGTTDGPGTTMDPATNRLDRLRLLGNGVVPQVAAHAFRVLSARLIR